MDLLPGMSETPELGAGSTFRWVEQAEATVDADNWVTVYGFQHCDAGVVLEEFRRCGEVVR